MTSFEFFEILNLILFHLFKHYLIFYLLKMIQYDKKQHLHIKVYRKKALKNLNLKKISRRQKACKIAQ